MKTRILAAAILLSACAPAVSPTTSSMSDPEPKVAAKPPLPKPPLPPGVTRNPDGSVTIHEPRCPSCQPWGF